ncbi:MAG: ABC transporter permease, partial [bacterium]
LLGSLGLGIVVLRNVYERAGELALLRAVGFRSSDLQTLVFREHALLLSMGLIVGTLAALIAVLPSLLSPGANIPYLSLSVTIGAVFLSGFLFAYLAARFALNAPLLNALRHE